MDPIDLTVWSDDEDSVLWTGTYTSVEGGDEDVSPQAKRAKQGNLVRNFACLFQGLVRVEFQFHLSVLIFRWQSIRWCLLLRHGSRWAHRLQVVCHFLWAHRLAVLL